MNKKIIIQENEKPKLPLCKMSCDCELAEHLNNFDLNIPINR